MFSGTISQILFLIKYIININTVDRDRARPIHFSDERGRFENQIAGSRSSKIDVLVVLVLRPRPTQAQGDDKFYLAAHSHAHVSDEEMHKNGCEHGDVLGH